MALWLEDVALVFAVVGVEIDQSGGFGYVRMAPIPKDDGTMTPKYRAGDLLSFKVKDPGSVRVGQRYRFVAQEDPSE